MEYTNYKMVTQAVIRMNQAEFVKNQESGYIPPAMEGRQIRAARALLGWKQADLCREAKISQPTLQAIEQDTGDPRRSSITAVERVFAKHGVTFFEDGDHIGVLFSKRRR